MKYITKGRQCYPESIQDCNETICGDCVCGSFNLKSLVNCPHRDLLEKFERCKK